MSEHLLPASPYTRRTRSPKEDATVAEAVRHPLRARILEVLNERDMCPVDFVDQGYADSYFAERPSVSHVAYHFRELAGFGSLEVVAHRRARGAVATIYRGVPGDQYATDEWASLPPQDKQDISKHVARGLIARIDGAIRAGTFTSRDDLLVSWFSMRFDERAWDEASKVLHDAFGAIGEIQEAAEVRLEDEGKEGITTTASIFLFESPALPGSPGSAD